MSISSKQLEKIEALHTSLKIPKNYKENRQLKPFSEVDLNELVVSVIDYTGRPIVLKKTASLALRKLLESAVNDNVSVLPFSSFRSYKYQATLIEAQLKKGRSIDEILTNIAAPGFSEHHTGCAVDITTEGVKPLSEEFESTESFKWLTKNAGSFGFRMSYPRDNKDGFIYEPWHWFYEE